MCRRKRPWDLYQADYKPGVKLYVKRVFITDDSKELLPGYLRFLRGIIDSEDLPLNVSREILQQNKILNAIRTASVKKVLSELKSIADRQARRICEVHRRVQPACSRKASTAISPTAKRCSNWCASSRPKPRAGPAWPK